MTAHSGHAQMAEDHIKAATFGQAQALFAGVRKKHLPAVPRKELLGLAGVVGRNDNGLSADDADKRRWLTSRAESSFAPNHSRFFCVHLRTVFASARLAESSAGTTTSYPQMTQINADGSQAEPNLPFAPNHSRFFCVHLRTVLPLPDWLESSAGTTTSYPQMTQINADKRRWLTCRADSSFAPNHSRFFCVHLRTVFASARLAGVVGRNDNGL
ncbi:MAG: hypothetical protein ABJD11_04800, partial [Gemmatimonadota bacterium]